MIAYARDTLIDGLDSLSDQSTAVGEPVPSIVTVNYAKAKLALAFDRDGQITASGLFGQRLYVVIITPCKWHLSAAVSSSLGLRVRRP